MLLFNVLPSFGLANETICTIKKYIQLPDFDTEGEDPGDRVDIVLVKFSSHTVRVLFEDEPMLVPVFMAKALHRSGTR